MRDMLYSRSSLHSLPSFFLLKNLTILPQSVSFVAFNLSCQRTKSFVVRYPNSLPTAFIYFSQGSPISPLRTVIKRSPVHPKNYKIQYNLKILKRKFTHYNIAKTSIKEVKISSWPRRKPN